MRAAGRWEVEEADLEAVGVRVRWAAAAEAAAAAIPDLARAAARVAVDKAAAVGRVGVGV